MDPQNPQDSQPNGQQPADQASQVLQFVDELIDQKFVDSQEEVTPEIRDELRQDLLLRLDEFIMAKVIAELSDEDLATFENLMKEGKSCEELQKFATEKISDFTDFATDAFLEFRTVYLSDDKEE